MTMAMDPWRNCQSRLCAHVLSMCLLSHVASVGIGAVSTGHCHPRVVAAVQQQAARVVHAQQNIFAAHEAGVRLQQAGGLLA